MLPTRVLLERMAALFAGGAIFSPDEDDPFIVYLVLNNLAESFDLTLGDLGDPPSFINSNTYGGGDHQNRFYYDPRNGDLVCEQQFDPANDADMFYLSVGPDDQYPITVYGYALVNSSGNLIAYKRFDTPVVFTKPGQGMRVPWPTIAFPVSIIG